MDGDGNGNGDGRGSGYLNSHCHGMHYYILNVLGFITLVLQCAFVRKVTITRGEIYLLTNKLLPV